MSITLSPIHISIKEALGGLVKCWLASIASSHIVSRVNQNANFCCRPQKNSNGVAGIAPRSTRSKEINVDYSDDDDDEVSCITILHMNQVHVWP